MARLVRVMQLAEIGDGSSKVVRVEGRNLAVFRVDGEFYVMDNACLHRGGPLGEGSLDGFNIICPWHGWTYDVRTGSLEVIPALKERTYPVKLEGGYVYVELDGAGPSG